jgi:hypothetical protein
VKRPSEPFLHEEILPDARGRQIDYSLTPSHVLRLLLRGLVNSINSGPSPETLLLAARGLAVLVAGGRLACFSTQRLLAAITPLVASRGRPWSSWLLALLWDM